MVTVRQFCRYQSAIYFKLGNGDVGAVLVLFAGSVIFFKGT